MDRKLIVGAVCLFAAHGALANYSYNGCGGGNTPPPASTCASYTWNFSSTSPNSNPPGVAVAATGFHQDYATNDTFTARPLTIYGTDHLSLNYDNGGSGTESSPYHAIDNNSGYDLVVFQFAAPVTLSQISMGYVNSDSDFSLFAFNPVAPGTAPIAGAPPGSDAFSLGNMLTKGWELIGSFDYDALAVNGKLNLETVTAGAPNSGVAKNILDYASSYWAVSAVYDSIANTGAKYGSDVKSNSGSTTGNDRFKIASIAGCYDEPNNPPGVREPASLALMLVGMVGMRKTLQRRAQR